ncbi:hypothetical protein BD413DRAFT_680504 [Trametes elegans]|nr:hypothetical protein BD413DRAFT_680504 [Trametes elegans]
MHFGRTHSRSKSRSPAPSSPANFTLSSSTRPPNFLPPSHYAAAAGLLYQHDTHLLAGQVHESSDMYASHHTEPTPEEPSSVGLAEGPSHVGAMGRLMSRASSKRTTMSWARAECKEDKEQRDQRKSQLADIPLLEAHLLPSLRDTVDRMTQPPKQSIETSESGDSRPSLSRIPRSTPEPPATTQIPRFRTQPSPVPKSALKSPARRSVLPPATPSASPLQRQAKSRHTTRSTPREYASGDNGAGSRESDRHRSPAAGVPVPASRTMLRAPSAIPKPHSDKRSKSNPGTPQVNHRYSVFGTPQPSRPSANPSSSSLPRPKPSRDHLAINDSGSELERRVGRTLSPGRLVVANAVIVPSSSESDHATKSRNRRSRWLADAPPPPSPRSTRQNHTRQQSKAQVHRDACVVEVESRNMDSATVGLGLSVESGFSGRQERFAIDGDESLYEEDIHSHSLIVDEPVLVPSDDEDADSIYASDPVVEEDFRTLPSSQGRITMEDRRRQEALLGIVNGLRRNLGVSSPVGGHDGLSESEGGAFGLAIGGSTDLQNGSSTSSFSLPRAPIPQPSPDFYASEASHSDDESTYSDHGAYDLGDTTDLAIPQKQPANGRSPASLRQHRTSWKRPLSSLAVQETAYVGRRSPSPSRQSVDRRRPPSPHLSPAPRSPRTRESSPTASDPIHRRSKSGYQPPSLRMDMPTSRRNSSHRQSAESGSRSSRLLSASPGLSAGNTKYAWDDVSSRERLGFGIPESLSYCGNVTPDEQAEGTQPPLSRLGSLYSAAPGLSRAESELSVAEAGWQNQARISKELSKGAAALFDALTSKADRSRSGSQPLEPLGGNEQQNTPLAGRAYWDREGDSAVAPPYPERSGFVSSRRRSVGSVSISSESSPPSEYEENASAPQDPASEEEVPSPPQVLVHEAPSSWQSTLSPEVYGSLRKHYGPTEIDRQELIYTLLCTEQAFVRSARRVVRTILLPLRARDSRAWLPGLPPDVARFFDWLEDIVNLHAAVAHTLSAVAAIWATGSIVQRVATTLKGFVPRLEVYMPYLAKYEGVCEAVRWHLANDRGEFGEYLRMREMEREGGDWALEQLLEEPAVRLRGYLDVFQRLGELTPQEHPDYLATLSLLYSARTSVRVMEEVKAREEEYDFVKELSSRIDGLPSTPALARRARRLLWFGILIRMPFSPREELPTPTPVAAPGSGNGAFSPRSVHGTPRQGREKGEQGASRLATAIRDWTTRRSRAGSHSSYASSTLSAQTYSTTSSASSASVLVTPRSDQFPGIRLPASRSKGHVRSPHVPRTSQGAQVQPSATEAALNVMVFSDLVVLAVPNAIGTDARSSDEEQRSHLLADVGLSRILGVEDIGDGQVKLKLIPIPPDQLDTGITVENTTPTSVTLSCPPSDASAADSVALLRALRKCHHHTVRGLSYPSLPAVITDDLELDTRQSLVGILSSGLPLPKSPSMQFQDGAQAQDGGDHTRGEREERGWWTLRFQQVLRELHRESVPISLASVWVPESAIAS